MVLQISAAAKVPQNQKILQRKLIQTSTNQVHQLLVLAALKRLITTFEPVAPNQTLVYLPFVHLSRICIENIRKRKRVELTVVQVIFRIRV